MKRYFATLCATILLVSGALLAGKKKGPDPALGNIHKLFVKGNNEAAADMRKILTGQTGRMDNLMSGHGSQGGGFTLDGNEADVDAVLEVGQEMTRGGLEGMTAVVSGPLTDKQGNLNIT